MPMINMTCMLVIYSRRLGGNVCTGVWQNRLGGMRCYGNGGKYDICEMITKEPMIEFDEIIFVHEDGPGICESCLRKALKLIEEEK